MASNYGLRRFSNPAVLKAISQPLLIRFFAPHRAFLAGRGFALTEAGPFDHEALAAILMSPDEQTPDAMLDALFFVDEMSQPELFEDLMDEARAAGVELGGGDKISPADLAVRVWLEKAEAYVDARIAYRVERLCKKFRRPEMEPEDFEQDFRLRLLAGIEEYLSSHQLLDFIRCPWLHRKKALGLIEDKDSPAYLVGRAAHVRILEGRDAYEDAFALGGPINPKTGKPFGSATKAFAEWALAQGKPVLSHGQVEMIEQMASGVAMNDEAVDLLLYYSVHLKRDAPEDHPRTMRVDYRCGFNDYHSEWVCPEHTGYARQKFEAWWRARSNEPFPSLAEEAVDLAEARALAPTHAITVRSVAGEKFDRITDYQLGPIPPRLDGRDERDDGDLPDYPWPEDEVPF